MHTNIDDEASPESVRWFGKLIEQGHQLLEDQDGDEELDENEAIIT